MASVLTSPSPDRSTQPSTEHIAKTHDAAPKAAHAVAARDLDKLGRAATVIEGNNWITLTTVIIFHAGALAAFFFFSWQRLAVMAILYVLAINVGIGMCYHRLLTHRVYHTPKWIEFIMAVCATMSLEGGPIFWVATLLIHHQLSDHEGDPHTPREGGWC